jgi:hypothetical protein
MASLLADHQVAFDYSLGWSHSIAEVFAEDYAYIHTHSRYGITWLSPPDVALQSTMFAELGTPTEPLPSHPRFRSSSTGAGRLHRSTGSASPSASSGQVGE